MEEFSDTSQSNLPENEVTDISVFNVPEIILQKIIPSQSEKNISPPSDKGKKTDKQDDLT